MKFLEVFNEIAKGNYALTDEAVYASIQNGDEFIPLYGGNKSHCSTERRISISAKTKKGVPITVFSGEGIIISLDGSAGSMTYKSRERFALNHHAGFITLREDAKEKVNLEFFAIYLQNYYRNLSVSDGSKTLSLTQIYSEEFDLPPFDVQCRSLDLLKKTAPKIEQLTRVKEKLTALMEKEFSVDYHNYQGKAVPISDCIDYLSGNSGLTEEVVYQMLHNEGPRYVILSSAAEGNSTLGEVPFCQINGRPLKTFVNQEGLLVNRKGKAGITRYIKPGMYSLNDDAYILFNKADSPYSIDLRWLGMQYRKTFLSYSSSADNGTWNMTGFFQFTKIDIPDIKEQTSLVRLVEGVQEKIARIDSVISRYDTLLCKELAV